VRNRHAPPPQELPKVLQAVDKMGPVKSFSMATFMAGVNAKNVALLLVFLLSLLASPRPVVWTIATVGTFILLASITILIPVVVTLTLGNRADRILEKWRGWMVANQNFIMNGFIGVIGLVLLAQGLGL
jgi:hypothetical protein